MRERKILYQLLCLIAASGIIVSYIFSPGTITPTITKYTVLSALVLFCAEYLWLRESRVIKGRATDKKWIIRTLIILVLLIIPELIILIIAAFIWAIALLVLGLAALTLIIWLALIPVFEYLQKQRSKRSE